MFKLIESADVFIHSMRHQAIEKLGFSYEEVAKVNPAIIYCGGYGFSKQGPYASKPAYDDMIQGASGLAAAQSETSGKPQYMATVLADKATGLMMANTILAAAYYRKKTGEGQYIEVPMFETIASFTLLEHMYGATFTPPIGSSLYPRLTSKYRKPYETEDGFISVIVYNDKQWKKFFEISAYPEFSVDIRFRDLASRTKHINELYQLLEKVILTKKTEEWLEIFEKADIPAMPMNIPEDLLGDPHLNAINFFEKMNHPSEGDYWNMSFPATFSKTPVKLNHFAPRLGEHSKEILQEAGYSEQAIDSLLESGVTFENR
ncbi:CoA transferase [Pueribacillus theae]|uniref:CoA transferase n=1 Tax=Pueribacillus theae TaxID=2171751 RepID=A0A2U1K3X2_9BACI|nr:CoA transferase [Pueribacillus theae]